MTRLLFAGYLGGIAARLIASVVGEPDRDEEGNSHAWWSANSWLWALKPDVAEPIGAMRGSPSSSP
jgi:hypothetical protein